MQHAGSAVPQDHFPMVTMHGCMSFPSLPTVSCQPLQCVYPLNPKCSPINTLPTYAWACKNCVKVKFVCKNHLWNVMMQLFSTYSQHLQFIFCKNGPECAVNNKKTSVNRWLKCFAAYFLEYPVLSNKYGHWEKRVTEVFFENGKGLNVCEERQPSRYWK